jgi:SAM-dependent methyltransferase
MHYSAMKHGELFFQTYANGSKNLRILDLGSQDVNGSLRTVSPAGSEYIGVDFTEGKGVDVIIENPYELPFDDGHFDMCVSSSCFEHSEMFWLVFLEMLRVLKPSGLLYLNVPSNSAFHRYPVDCWRFYPDAGKALEKWAVMNEMDTVMLESFTGHQHNDSWNDFVTVFFKGKQSDELPNVRIMDNYNDFDNGQKFGTDEITNLRKLTEDQRAVLGLKHQVQRLI